MSQTALATISPKEFVELKRSGKTPDLIDVRTPVEYRSIHAEGARNIPLDRLDAASISQEKQDDGPIYVICHTGSRASKACEMFKAAGNANVVSVEGGTKAWEEAGLPVVRGKKAMSLERQVRIAAGSIVLLGIGLGFLVDEYLFGLSGFVGAGLVFAGITDTCGMGMLLARMPWNQVAKEPQSQCAS